MKLIATIAIRRHGADDWDEPDNSKHEIKLFRVVGGSPAQALKTVEKIAADIERKPIVVLTFEGLRKTAARHHELCSQVMQRCRSLDIEFALCAIDAADPAIVAAPHGARYPGKIYASVVEYVAQLTRPGPAKKRPAPTGRAKAAALHA